jgi:hypothetical protein
VFIVFVPTQKSMTESSELTVTSVINVLI